MQLAIQVANFIVDDLQQHYQSIDNLALSQLLSN